MLRIDGGHGRIDNGRRFFMLFVVFLSAFQSRMLGDLLAVGRFGRAAAPSWCSGSCASSPRNFLDRCRELRPQGAQLFDRRISRPVLRAGQGSPPGFLRPISLP